MPPKFNEGNLGKKSGEGAGDSKGGQPSRQKRVLPLDKIADHAGKSKQEKALDELQYKALEEFCDSYGFSLTSGASQSINHPSIPVTRSAQLEQLREETPQDAGKPLDRSTSPSPN